MRPVNFDKHNQPVTKEDEKNHAWNLKWLRAWEEDDVSTREEMLEEILPHLYDGIKIPDLKLKKSDREKLLRWNETEAAYEKARSEYEKCEENSPRKQQLKNIMDAAQIDYQNAEKAAETLGESYWGTYAKWLEGLVTSQDLNLVNAGTAGLCIETMRKIHPSVDRFFKKNPAFQKLSEMVDIATKSFGGSVLSKKCRLRMGNTVSVIEEINHTIDMQSYSDIMSNDTTLFKKTKNVVANKEYIKDYQKAKDVLGGSGDLSRNATAVMRYVNFDKNGKPLTKQDDKLGS